MKKLLVLMVLMASVAYAAFEDSGVFVEAPSALVPEAEQLFSFYAVNAGTSGDPDTWIRKIVLAVPSDEYEVVVESVEAPAVAHPDDECAVASWDFALQGRELVFVSYAVDPLQRCGDVRAGESAAFTFRAVVDAGPSDGFDWLLETVGGAQVSGTLYVGTDDTDDDEDDTDDDTVDDDDAVLTVGDDDDEGGCGC